MKLNALAVALALVAALALPTAVVSGAGPQHLDHVRLPPLAVTVQIDNQDPGAPVPERFLGLSFEVAAAGQISHFANAGDFEAMLRSAGPGVLRLGGASADTRTAWTGAHAAKAAWASGELDPGDLRRLASIVKRTGWRVLLTVGLAHYNPHAAAQEVAAARAAFGSTLIGIEIGNEPDAYGEHGLRTSNWSASQYNAQTNSYRNAVAALTPGISVAGPDVSGSSAFEQWGPLEVSAQRPALLTGHHYPLGCHGTVEPSIFNLLSVETRNLEDQSLNRYMALSHASGIPFRMDETNSVSCGGTAGVSDTFASALWATNFIAHTMAAGASGINLQGNPSRCSGYSPICASSPGLLAKGTLQAQPEWYAVLLTHKLIGDRPIAGDFAQPLSRNVTVTAFQTPGGALQLVAVDDDPLNFSGVALRLDVGHGYGRASVLTLSAPTPAATGNVKLGGQTVESDGSWHQPKSLPHPAVNDGVVTVEVAPSSAALITVAPAAQG